MHTLTPYGAYRLLSDLGISLVLGYVTYGLLCWREHTRTRHSLSSHELDQDGQYQLKGYDARPNVRKR